MKHSRFPRNMEKATIVKQLRDKVRDQYERAVAALEGAREAATGDDTKAENKYDTRGLEASYLAAGQASQADELGRAMTALNTFEFPEFDFDDPIENGALVEVDSNGEVMHYLLSPAGGGLTLDLDDGGVVTVLGPASPLRQKMTGLMSGTTLESPPLMILEVF